MSRGGGEGGGAREGRAVCILPSVCLYIINIPIKNCLVRSMIDDNDGRFICRYTTAS